MLEIMSRARRAMTHAGRKRIKRLKKRISYDERLFLEARTIINDLASFGLSPGKDINGNEIDWLELCSDRAQHFPHISSEAVVEAARLMNNS